MSGHERLERWEPATVETVIRLERRPIARLYLDDEMQTVAWTNVPVTVICHSPSGYEWGYRGSGPSDLALNILNWLVPPGADGMEPVRCWNGACSRTAWALHHDFKESFLAGMPREGGEIPGTVVLTWIAAWLICPHCGAVLPGGTRRCEGCGHRFLGECDCAGCHFTRQEAEWAEQDGRAAEEGLER